MNDDIVALLRNSLKASEDLVRARAAHIKKLEFQIELLKAAYQAASRRGQHATPSAENSLLVEIQEHARRSKLD